MREEPAEFTGPPKAIPQAPSPILVRFAQNETIRKADPKQPDTIAPALAALDAFVKEAPKEASIRWMRGGVLCETGAPPQQVLGDLDVAVSLLNATPRSVNMSLELVGSLERLPSPAHPQRTKGIRVACTATDRTRRG